MPFTTTADGASLYYETAGRGEPLLLLAGQANNHHWWDPVRADFEAEFTVVVLDWRGTGASDHPDTDTYSTRGFAADALRVLDALGVDRAHVYGTSMGGRAAQWLAVDHPARVDRLVLGCTTPGRRGVPRTADVNRSLAQLDAEAARRALLELMYTPAWLREHPGPFTTLGDPDMPPHARRRHFTASAAHDAWDVLPSITAPTLVVHGADDRFNPAANAPLLAERIPGARLHLLPGARHAYFEEFRATASPLVLDFLAGKRNSPSPGTTGV